MKTPHEVALSIAKLIRESLYVNDGSLRPCLGTELNPQWVQARAANIATAIVGSYDVRPNAVAGEIETPDETRSRYGFDAGKSARHPEDLPETMEEHAERIIK